MQRLAGQGSHGGGKSLTWEEAKSTIFEWRLWMHYFVSSSPCGVRKRLFFWSDSVWIYFGISAPFSSLSLFTPSITAGLGVSHHGSAYLSPYLMPSRSTPIHMPSSLTVPPYAAAYVVTLLVSWSADRLNA